MTLPSGREVAEPWPPRARGRNRRYDPSEPTPTAAAAVQPRNCRRERRLTLLASPLEDTDRLSLALPARSRAPHVPSTPLLTRLDDPHSHRRRATPRPGPLRCGPTTFWGEIAHQAGTVNGPASAAHQAGNSAVAVRGEIFADRMLPGTRSRRFDAHYQELRLRLDECSHQGQLLSNAP